MRTSIVVALLVGLTVGLVGGLAGCGGSGSAPPQPTTSAIEGEVDIAGNVGDYELLLDGQPVPGVLRADGSYTIGGVLPGHHRIAVVARDGMMGAYCTVEVGRGERVRAPRVTPELGGQIVGIVSLHGDDGLRPLAGVEVTAQPAVVIAAEEGDGEAHPEIWPPPELPTFSAFTDENGSYVIRAVPPGEYIVTVAQQQVRHNAQWVFVEAGHTAVADFELWPEVEAGVGTVRGRVVGRSSDGSQQPVVGARVTIRGEVPWWSPQPPPLPPEEPLSEQGDGGGESVPGAPLRNPDLFAPPPLEWVSTLTDENGEYALNAPAGRASIEVWAPGWQSAWEEIIIIAGETVQQNFVLEPWDDELPQPGPSPMPLPPDDDLESPAPPAMPGEVPGGAGEE